jgi:hypothetical protein
MASLQAKRLTDKKLSTKEYEFICEILWGCIPIDRIWAERTSLFTKEYESILAQYPKLDGSFFN